MVNAVTQESETQYFNHELIKKRCIEFRSYQENISESIRNKNTLVILPTALGKTVIAILVCAEFLYNYKSKRILVMAPTKPLVAQHLSSFFSVLNVPEDGIAVVTGKNLPSTRMAIWNRKEIRLVFATPEVVKNDLAENRLSLSQFSLLVFDEAHRAVKDYAYTSIARYYFQQSSHPVILAMTASPGSEKTRLEEVCNNLYIEQIEYRNEEDIDVKPYLNPIDVTWKWFTIPPEYKYISSILRVMLENKLQFLIERGLLRKKHPKWIFKNDLINLGEEIQYKLELTMEELRGPLYTALMQQSSALTLMYCAELIESQGSPSLKAFLERIENDGGKAHQSLLNDNRIREIQTLLNSLKIEHPKTRYLVDHLKQHYSFFQNDNQGHVEQNVAFRQSSDLIKRPKALVFTHYRDTARNVVEILTENGIKASRFVGQAKRELDIGMSQEEQSAVLESFRNGEFDVLVATSIAEEGLDIPEVDLVVFYEPIPSEIRYIQRRGRTGRKSSGCVIILAAKDTIDERYLYASKRRMEKMKQILSGISVTLKPIQRADVLANPMTPQEVLSYELNRTAFDKQVDKILIPPVDIMKKDGSPPSIETRNQLIRKKDRHRMELLSLQSHTLTNGFRREIDSAARRIHTLIAKSGRQPLDIDIIQQNLSFENSVLLEALKKLEKLKRIEWVDDSKVILSENLARVSGNMYDIYVEKIIHGRALVTVDGKWHARLNHYDYEGPRELLRKGSEFKVVGELYRDEGVFSLRVKQIVS
ncbi:MAG TPA: helicase-related protein [Nitrososphaeraceae archaeon]|nr:helicase-related protein [Nitrososphaeraceae archaeon]